MTINQPARKTIIQLERQHGEGLGELTVGLGRSLVLNALTFGGYGAYELGNAMWDGYKEDGVVGALNAVNPLYHILRGGTDAVLAAERGDYRAASAAGTRAVVLTLGAAVGLGEGLAALSGRAAAAAARGASIAREGTVGAMRRLDFEASPKHPVGVSPRHGVSPGPVHGQDALDVSVGISENTTRRVGIDYITQEFVVFDETHPGKGIFHGHVRTWSQLDQSMQNALVRSGMAHRRGKILTD